jgi:hypothetical protein
MADRLSARTDYEPERHSPERRATKRREKRKGTISPETKRYLEAKGRSPE